MSDFLIDKDTDLLAAEFVLGTLDSEERANAQSRLLTDHGFIAMVRIWERRFGELHLMVEPVEPDEAILQRVKAKIAEVAAGEPAPDGKSPVETAPGPQSAETSVTPASPQMPKAANIASAETANSVEVPAEGVTPIPEPIAEPAATERQTESPAPEATAAAPVALSPDVAPADAPTVPETPPTAEAGPPESPMQPERGPVAKVTIPAPPSLPPQPLRPPDKLIDRLPDRLQAERMGRPAEITIDVIRSRSRWRMVGAGMTLLVMGLVALLAAWRFAPDRLPARLRPAELMMSIGILAGPQSEPVAKPPPPPGQFDE